MSPHGPTRATPLSRREFLSGSVAAISVLGLGACRSARTGSQSRGVAAGSGDIARVVEALTRSIPRTMARQDVPGVSIALVHRGAVVWADGLGFTDRERHTPVRADTGFSV